MANTDREEFDILHPFLLSKWESVETFDEVFDHAITTCDDFIYQLTSNSGYHHEVLATRGIEMTVRDTLYRSTFELPVAIQQNHEDWLTYMARIRAALPWVQRTNDCANLLRRELSNLADAWDQLWDYEEAQHEYADGDGQKMSEITDNIKYFDDRRLFLEERIDVYIQQVDVLFEEEPVWLGFV